MESKICTKCNIGEHINNFTKNIQNVKIAIVKEA